MSTTLEYLDINDMKNFLDLDRERIRKLFPIHSCNGFNFGEKTVFITPRMCLQVPADNFKNDYRKLFDPIIGIMKTLDDGGIWMNCTEVELIVGDGIGSINGKIFQFKLTFEK